LWTDGRVLRLNTNMAKFIFVGLISQSDDEGIVEADAHVLKAALALKASTKSIDDALERITNVGLGVRYQENGQAFVFLPGFFKHQRLDRPTPTKHPRPPAELLAKYPWYVKGRREAFNRPNSRHKGLFDGDTPDPGQEDSDTRLGHVSAASQTCLSEKKRKEKKTRHMSATPTLADAPPAADGPPTEEIVSAWNDMAERLGLSTVQKLTNKRKRALNARWKEDGWRDGWQKALATIPKCPFLVSDQGGSWTANFDWFLQPDSVAKVLEGQYAKAAQGAARQRPLDRNAELRRVVGAENIR